MSASHTIFRKGISGALLACCFFPLSTRINEKTTTVPAQKEVTTIALNAIPGLQYDEVRIVVKPGSRVKITLTNKDDMSHNLVITTPGKRLEVVHAAVKLGEKGPSLNYIPQSPDVLWSIPVLSPGQAGSITFTAPEKTGIYPYVCTFPGHGFSMYGAMYVMSAGELPELLKDENVPPARRKGNDTNDSHASPSVADHPYPLTPPYLYRAYMMDASPAAIAVRLTDNLAYCWDAGSCELRYVWEGGFVDNTGLWKGKPNSEAKVLGKIFYRNSVTQPLRTGSPDRIQQVEFRGYKLINRYPEFHYTVDGTDVYELIRPTEKGDGLIRTFTIPRGNEDVWFIGAPTDGMKFESTAGTWRKQTLLVPVSGIKNFSIVMTKREGRKP
ncbi:MAG TPA: plastocyanin/azurin family copper-binding protein [Chryseosolibacter sp.]